jgi:ribose transport system permease protein
VGVCTAVGGFSGLMITTCGLPPFIVTLGVMLMASGLAFRLSAGASIPELPRSFFWLGGGTTWGLPHPVWLMIGLYGLAHAIMSRTVFGRYVYAIGSNQEAARLAGVAVQPLLVVVYMVSAGLAGLIGVVQASMLQAGDPKFGLMYELEVIAAVVVGGTSLMGGRGKVLGTLIGAFIIAVIKNGMNLTNIDPFNQKIVLGAVLLLAVGLDTVKRQGWPNLGFRRSGTSSNEVSGRGASGSGVN